MMQCKQNKHILEKKQGRDVASDDGRVTVGRRPQPSASWNTPSGSAVPLLP